jgi:hypothetical protein
MSELRANTISNAAGTGPVTLTGQYASKAWVNFNGIGTVAIRESDNVSSITDNGTGTYTVTFTTAMADTNYAPTGSVKWGVSNGAVFYARAADTLTTSSYQLRTRIGSSGTLTDPDYVYGTFLR